METIKGLFVDIGASYLRIGISRGRTIVACEHIPTPADWDVAKALILQHAQRQAVQCIILGVPGTIDQRRRKIIRSPNLSSWVGIDLRTELEKGSGLPVAIENDALLNALGEAVYGAGKKYSIVGFVTISTGVNGARVVDGQIDQGAFGYELGLLPIHGVTIESIISGRALSTVHGVDPSTLPRTTWQSVERSLSTIVLQMMILWRPEVIILAGPMIRQHSIEVQEVLKLLQKRWQHPAPMPELVSGSLKDHSGMYGGRAYLDLHSEDIFGRVQKRS